MNKKELKKINIQINSPEEDRSDIIYNNLISNLNLTEEEQIKYLKNKATKLELEIKNKTLTALLIMISLIGISFGIILLINDLYILGSLFIFTTFIGVITRFYLMYKNVISKTKVNDFDRIDHLKEILESKLK